MVSVNNLIEYIKTVCLAECSENDKVKVFEGIVEEEYYKNFVFYNTDESEIDTLKLGILDNAKGSSSA